MLEYSAWRPQTRQQQVGSIAQQWSQQGGKFLPNTTAKISQTICKHKILNEIPLPWSGCLVCPPRFPNLATVFPIFVPFIKATVIGSRKQRFRVSFNISKSLLATNSDTQEWITVTNECCTAALKIPILVFCRTVNKSARTSTFLDSSINLQNCFVCEVVAIAPYSSRRLKRDNSNWVGLTSVIFHLGFLVTIMFIFRLTESVRTGGRAGARNKERSNRPTVVFHTTLE